MKLPNALKIIMDVSSIGIVVFDHEAIVVYPNHVAHQLFDHTEETLISSKCGNFSACHLLDEPDTPVSGDYVRLSVMDDGCGMDQQTLVPIFAEPNNGKQWGIHNIAFT